jgi:hypothetical protein
LPGRSGEKSKRKGMLCSISHNLFSKIRRKLLDLLAHNTFNECADASKQIGQNLYKKINLDQSNSEDIRCGFKAALRCLEAAVYLVMDVLRAHN